MSRCHSVKFVCCASLLLALHVLGGRTTRAQWEIQRPPPPPSDVEVLTRGPVHEAFAETVVYDTEEDVVVLKPPPEPLDEVPPTEAPDASNVAWIPGYWAWDDDRDDYLWVSGIWRVVPPGRQYVSGFWSRSGHGFDWTSGFWADADDNDIQYLPDPPASAESGPPGPPPTPNHVWVPGTWLWMDGRYVWRPGSWTVANPNWVWVPAHYVAGPHGAVFVEGYWDYPVERRGILFAPVYVTAAVRGPRFVYTPSIVIDTTVFIDHLFVRPRYHHYYFGDYYEASYTARGIIPWFAVETNRIAYDPIFEHRRWMHRDDRDWGRRVETDFHFRREHVEARPPRTLSVQINIGGQPQVDRRLVIARPLAQLAVHAEAPIRLRTVAPAEREVIVQRSVEVKKAREQRKVVEEKELADKGGQRTRVTAPVRVKLPPTTVATKKDAVAAKEAAPKKPETSKADTTVQPRPKPTTAKKPPELVAPTPTKKEAESTRPPPKPAENQPPPAKKPVEAPPPAAKKPIEPSPAPPPKKPAEVPPPAAKKPVEPPPPAAKKPPEQLPPPAKKPAEPPPQAKKESPDKSKDKDKDKDDDDDNPDSPKGKAKKKDKKDDDK